MWKPCLWGSWWTLVRCMVPWTEWIFSLLSLLRTIWFQGIDVIDKRQVLETGCPSRNTPTGIQVGLLSHKLSLSQKATITTMRSSTSVLPAPYFYFFWLLEPILTVAGGVSAIYDPISFGGNTLPRNIERATLKMGNTVRGQIVVSELGSCKSCSKLPLGRWRKSGLSLVCGLSSRFQVSCCWLWSLSRSSTSLRNTWTINLCYRKS